MKLLLGVDTLSYHCRLEAREVTHEAIFVEASELGFSFVQLNAYHLRALTESELMQLRELAAAMGLELTLSGDVIGRAGRQDSVASGVARIAGWIEMARLIGSPFVRVSSGFYRNELLGVPDAIAAEHRYITEVLSVAMDLADTGCRILLENHSDFTADEYVQIIERVDSQYIGVFLDLVNPVAMLLDPLPVVTRLVAWATAGHVKDFRLVSDYVEDHFHRRGFHVQYCYPGEGVADLDALVGVLASTARPEEYRLSVEGLDNRAGVADQRERLASSLARLGRILR